VDPVDVLPHSRVPPVGAVGRRATSAGRSERRNSGCKVWSSPYGGGHTLRRGHDTVRRYRRPGPRRRETCGCVALRAVVPVVPHPGRSGATQGTPPLRPDALRDGLMDTGYLANIDPAKLAALVAGMTRDGGNRVQVNIGDDGEILSAVASR